MPEDYVKIPGAPMGTRLNYKETIVRAMSKGQKAAVDLR
jgi:hypothetical protein